MILQQPNREITRLDIQHSTDWVVALSVLVSALISILGLLATIYVVRKSTEQNIESNRILFESQNGLRVKELEIEKSKTRSVELKNHLSEYLFLINRIHSDQRALHLVISVELKNGESFKDAIIKYEEKYNQICDAIDDIEKQACYLCLILNNNRKELEVYEAIRELNSLLNYSNLESNLKINFQQKLDEITEKTFVIEDLSRELIFDYMII